MSLVVAHDDLLAINALEVTNFGSLAKTLHLGLQLKRTAALRAVIWWTSDHPDNCHLRSPIVIRLNKTRTGKPFLRLGRTS